MKKEISIEIEVPKGTDVVINENTVIINGKEGELKRNFDCNLNKIKLEKAGSKIILSCRKATKMEKKNMNSVASHIKNMIRGVQSKFEYKLKICTSHFPVTFEIKGNEAIIKNFLGEKIPRKAKILDGCEIIHQKEFITIRSADTEKAGQTAANLEQATRISARDRRVFQDGIFITHKPKGET